MSLVSDPTPLIDYATLVDTILNRKPGAGKALAQLRNSAGLTQRQLANRFHRSPSVVASWELDTRWPPKTMLLSVMRQCSVPIQFCEAAIQQVIGGYGRRDWMETDWEYLQSRMPEVLQSLCDRAIEGSDKAGEIVLRYRDDLDERLRARVSKAIRINDSKRQVFLTGKGRLKPAPVMDSSASTGSGDAGLHNTELCDNTTTGSKDRDTISSADISATDTSATDTHGQEG